MQYLIKLSTTLLIVFQINIMTSRQLVFLVDQINFFMPLRQSQCRVINRCKGKGSLWWCLD